MALRRLGKGGGIQRIGGGECTGEDVGDGVGDNEVLVCLQSMDGALSPQRDRRLANRQRTA